MKEDNTRSI